MSNIILIALMQISALGADRSGFEQAYDRSLVTGRPLVVLIGASWCSACQKMKNSILPRVAGAGGLDKVVFTYVDFDQQRQLASRLSRAKSIPQLIRFDRMQTGWKSKCLVGAKSPREVYDFINAGLIDKSNVSKASAANRPGNGSRKSAPRQTPRSGAAASKSRTDASVDPPRRRGREVRSYPVGKTGVFSHWMAFLNKLSLERRNRDNSTAYQQEQPSEKRR